MKEVGNYSHFRYKYPFTLSAILIERVCNEKLLSFFSTKTYVVGTQKNGLNGKALLSTQNMLKLMGKKIFTILRKKNVYLIFHLDWIAHLIYINPYSAK